MWSAASPKRKQDTRLQREPAVNQVSAHCSPPHEKNQFARCATAHTHALSSQSLWQAFFSILQRPQERSAAHSEPIADEPSLLVALAQDHFFKYEQRRLRGGKRALDGGERLALQRSVIVTFPRVGYCHSRAATMLEAGNATAPITQQRPAEGIRNGSFQRCLYLQGNNRRGGGGRQRNGKGQHSTLQNNRNTCSIFLSSSPQCRVGMTVVRRETFNKNCNSVRPSL